MTQSSYFLANGSSLEDCHTNFFALADLCGIKWRQYTSDKHYNDLSEDPVLHSYTRCINADLLCVWRRVRNNTQDQSNRIVQDNYVTYTKELWIFWYGEEPDFADLIVNSLSDGEQGSWESGLSYECRTLLFKALHNLIEKCLLSKGYTRLGRWFFQVKYAQNADRKNKSDILNDGTQVTFAFNFFLHGDSNVCANVDVRQHSAIYPISREDLLSAQSTPGGLRVITAPFGLQAYLTGHVYKETDPSVQKFFADWRKVYPVMVKNSKDNGAFNGISSPFHHPNDDHKPIEDDYLNKVVELLIGDFKVKYPSCYVFINETDRKLRTLRPLKNEPTDKSLNLKELASQIERQSEEPLENCRLKMTPFFQELPSDTYCLKSSTNQAINFCDSLFVDKLNSSREEGSSEGFPGHTQLFGELLLKKACNCQKCQQVNLKKHLKSSGMNGLSSFNQFSSSKSKDRNLEKERAKYLKNGTPFHLRSSLSLSQDVDVTLPTSFSMPSSSQTASSPINSTINMSSSMNQSSATPIILSYKSPVSTSTSSILNTPGIESSPLSNFNLDTAEHISPITSKEENSSINTPINISSQLNQSPKEKSCLSSLSPNANSNSLSNNSETLNSGNKSVDNLGTVPNGDSVKLEGVTSQSQLNDSSESSPDKCSAQLSTKRSYLFKNIYEGDPDLRNGLLYDYSNESDFWDLPPAKNRRTKDGSMNINGYLNEMKKEFADNVTSYIVHELPQFKNKDPYEFNDIDYSEFAAKHQHDPSIEIIADNGPVFAERMNATFDQLPHKMVKGKETEVLTSKNGCNAKLFTRNEDDYPDFDQPANSSGDESNSENFQAPLTPKNSNGPPTNAHCETDSTSHNSASSRLSPEHLSKMYPTPPSLETVSSPCDKGDEDDEEELKDCSFVYKPPVQSSFITSNKYAPLENVECKHHLPTHCYYKHNVKKLQQTLKPFGMVPQQSQNCNIVSSKSKPPYLHINAKMSPFSNSSIRSMRPPLGQNMAGFNANYMPMNRVRPLGMQSQMFNFPADNFNANFRQNSPSLNIDGSSMSPMTNSFISSPLSNFDNRKSPFSFHQHVSHNSPSNPNAFMSNSPMNFASLQQQKMSPMVGSNFYSINNASAIEGNLNASMATPHFESNALMLNLLLSDSMLNLYRDHNFESCSICVCNMNIKGNDVGIYLPDTSAQQSNNYDYYQCTCGFSALSNRHSSQFSGLFYEDEVDITGILYDPSAKAPIESEGSGFFDNDLKKALGVVDESFINLLLSLSTTIFPSSSTFSKVIFCDRRPQFKTFNLKENSMRLFDRDPCKLVYRDYSEVILQSLNMTRIDAGASVKPSLLLTTAASLSTSRPVLHDWSFRNSLFPVNNHEVIHMLKSLQPLMQEAVQRKGSATGSEVTYNSVKGPLTWRQFHRLAGRGTEYQCEPQPIPSLLAGFDKDCVVVSPFALKFWEKLSLEPYAINRDVGYIALVPDNEAIQTSVKAFFRELSTTYELLRFGRHFPLRKVCKDGMFVVGTTVEKKNDSAPLDDWFGSLGESNLASKIRLYGQACCNLVPTLSVYERSLFEPSNSKSHFEVSNPSFMNTGSGNSSSGSNAHSMNGNLPNAYMSHSSSSSMFGGNLNSQRPMNNFSHLPNSSESQIERLLNENENGHMGGGHDPSICSIASALQPYEDEDDMHKYPAIVIYIVDPFAVHGREASKLGCIGLLKSFSNMLKFIPENVRNNVHVQLLSMDSIMGGNKDFRNISRQNQLKELSFSIYSQCKQQLIFQPNVKSLTGLGPAASFDAFLKDKDITYNKTQLYTTPFILAPLKDKQTELGEMFGDRREKSQILFCCYCLSEDQKWLLASCTNDKGDILQSKIINVEIPNRTRRRNAPVRRFGLEKLMSFVQTVMSESVLPWRLVIGRLGRIGHGELKDWASLLSKKSLLKYSRQLRDLCSQCRDIGPTDQPAIYSACLISLEADTALRVFPNYYTPDERFSSSCNTCSLSTPEDASCTHILVFPTSATTQSSHANFSMMDIGANLGEEFFGNLETDIPVEDDIDFDNFWNDALLGDPPGRDGPAPDSPGNRQSFGSGNLKNSNLLDDQDEPAQLLQQPLALAFYVSTARTGPLPRWFWANSPHLENTCPVFLKSALLIHTPFVHQNTDDLLNTNTRDCHSLDSNFTTEVLRCVLEGYNSLSWLALDPGTNDRLSCLPLHIQVLMQLYHSVQALM